MKNHKHISNCHPLLDSKLITATIPKELYNIKLIDCGSYFQVYYYENGKIKNISNEYYDDLNLKKKNIDDMFDFKEKSKRKKVTSLREIEEKNIIRSKLECQRLAKANMSEWETFITLTFEENMTDVEYAYKRFKNFIDKVRRIKKDLKYLCITEFQKRGATHYHLLTNISINDNKLIYVQEDNKKYRHIKYWLDGFTSVEALKNDPKKVIGYIAKYMTKDIDNRLFNHRRYFNSTNLNKPKTNYININDEKHINFYKEKIQNTSLIYQNEYINPYDNSKVIYFEYQK